MKMMIQHKKEAKLPILIELGPGKSKKREEAIGIDICKKPSVDYLADLSKGLPFLEDNSVDEIEAYHFLEHIEDIELFLSEIFRVLKPNGIFIGTVPHFSNPYFYSDYTHKSTWGLYSFGYFCKNTLFSRSIPTYYNTVAFDMTEIEIRFSSVFRLRHQIKKLLQRIFNVNRYTQELYEEHFVYLFPAYEIYFKLKKS